MNLLHRLDYTESVLNCGELCYTISPCLLPEISTRQKFAGFIILLTNYASFMTSDTLYDLVATAILLSITKKLIIVLQ